MPDYRLRVEAEYEAIERTLSALPARPLAGLENVLKQVCRARAIDIPSGRPGIATYC